MKRNFILMLAMLPFVFSNCSDNEEPPPPDPPMTQEQFVLNQLIKEYNIDKKGLVVEYATNGIDTTQLFVNGRIDGRLWIGCYNKVDKSQFLDWTETSKLDTVVEYYKGYGEYEKFKVDRFGIGYPYKNKDSYCFILVGGGYFSSSPWSTLGLDLYFINDKSLIKKPIGTNYSNSYRQIIPWYDGVVVEKIVENQNEYICYTMNGDSIYKLNYFTPRYVEINYEECIDFDTDVYPYDFKTNYFRRINLKTNEIIWENKNQPLNDLPSDVRIDKINIQKNDNIWVYEVNYTQFDGAKRVRKISLNIENGDFELI